MKLTLSTNSGVLLKVIPDIEEYDLTKAVMAIHVADDIQQGIKQAGIVTYEYFQI